MMELRDWLLLAGLFWALLALQIAGHALWERATRRRKERARQAIAGALLSRRRAIEEGDFRAYVRATRELDRLYGHKSFHKHIG
jgi:hypothetical protein